jgi:hypothetical protein
MQKMQKQKSAMEETRSHTLKPVQTKRLNRRLKRTTTLLQYLISFLNFVGL